MAHVSRIASSQVYLNLSIKELVEQALKRGEGILAANQALTVNTGKRTGRSPKDKFIVQDDITQNTVDWNTVNQPLTTEKFDALWKKANDYLDTKETFFVSYLQVGADEQFGIPVKVITELAWHTLFANVLFIRPAVRTIKDQPNQWALLCLPNFKSSPERDGINGDAAIILNFSQKRILICGTHYAGEIKKAMFSVLNFLLPAQTILPMHCAANRGKNGDTALFFGLSGTGKTTLSADPELYLIGDDE